MSEIDGSARPKLRWPLETESVDREGERFLLLRDPLGVAEAASVPLAVVPIVSRFDGQTTLEEIAAAGASFGVSVELCMQVAHELERMGFLENFETLARVAIIQKEFLDLDVRPAAFAGSIYPAEERELRKTIDGYIRQAENRFPDGTGEVLGLMCPHIDYHRGWRTYASAATILERVPAPDVIFLLGTSHSGGDSLFQLTRKGFASPFGTIGNAREIVDRIASRYGEDRSFRDEYLQKREHSLELQVPFLAHAYGSKPKIVPILVSSFHRFLLEGSLPTGDAEVEDFLSVLSEIVMELKRDGRTFLLYGGVDLAHMGLAFGDEARVSDTELPSIEARDRELLEALSRADERLLFEHMAEDCDRRRICGFPSLFTMLATFRRAGMKLGGKMLEYRQAVDPISDTVVTFASGCWMGDAEGPPPSA